MSGGVPPLPQQFVAELAGTWVREYAIERGADSGKVKVDTTVFRPDSTTNFSSGNKRQFARWHHLRADTLWMPGGPCQVTLKDQQLFMVNRPGTKFVYRRTDASKPAP
jgi:hypothetical protein